MGVYVGGGTAYDVLIRDSMTAGPVGGPLTAYDLRGKVTIVSVTSGGTTVPHTLTVDSASGAWFEIALGDLEPGRYYIKYKVDFSSLAPGIAYEFDFKNNARLSYREKSGGPVINKDTSHTDTVRVGAGSFLSKNGQVDILGNNTIAKWGENSSLYTGVIPGTVWWVGNGSTPISGYTITDTLPDGMKFTSPAQTASLKFTWSNGTTTTGTVTIPAGGTSFTVSIPAAGANGNVVKVEMTSSYTTEVATPSLNGVYTNTLSINLPGNPSYNATVTLGTPPVVGSSISKTGDFVKDNGEEYLEWTITVKKRGR